MRCFVRPLMLALGCVAVAPARAQVLLPPASLAFAEAAQPQKIQAPPVQFDTVLERWVDLQVGTLGLVFRQIDNGSGAHTLSAMQWAPAFKARVRFDRDARYTFNLGVQGGSNFKFSWNGTGVGSQDFMHDLPMRHAWLAVAPVKGVAAHVGSMPLARGESSEITTYDNDGYVVGERVVFARRDLLFFDEISVTNAFLGDFTAPSVFDRGEAFTRRNYRQVVVTRKVNQAVSMSADYSSHAGSHTLRQAVALRAPKQLGLDLLRFEQYQRLESDTRCGVALFAEKALTARLKVGGGFASVDTRYGTWNGDRYNVGDHVFAQVTMPLFAHLSFLGFYGRELHAPEASANLNRIDVQVTYDALAHWKASRR